MKVDPSSTVAGDFSYSGVARLAAGASPEDAQRELASVLPRIAESFPRLESGTSTTAWIDEARPTPVVQALRDEITNGIAHTLWMLALAAGLVLIVAWANVTNLMLIRADGRQLELAVREALGASRLRIMTHFLGESLVLTTAAGSVALLMAWGAVRALVAFGPADVPRLAEVGIDRVTVAFVVVVSVIGTIVCGALPAFRLRRANAVDQLSRRRTWRDRGQDAATPSRDDRGVADRRRARGLGWIGAAPAHVSPIVSRASWLRRHQRHDDLDAAALRALRRLGVGDILRPIDRRGRKAPGRSRRRPHDAGAARVR